MATLSEIYFNYNQAIEQAKQLDDVAQQLTNAANRDMEDVLNDVSRAWKSDSAPMAGRSRRSGTKARRRATLMPTTTMRPAITKRVPAKARMDGTSAASTAKSS